ncbi:efflux RND transporter periplasmic adaptor subunit [bacterium]|nr:efflux RND transporter periplasmic adaptor subunit [bacterium]
MTRTARTTLWIILLLIAIGVVSGLYMSVKLHFEHLPEEKAVIPVEVITAEVRPLMEELRYTGTVLAEPSAMVSAKVAGTIREVAVSEGDRVDEGAVLAVIEDTIYAEQVSLARHQTEAARAQLASAQSARPENIAQARAALAAAESALNTARNNHERNKKLFDEGVISEAQFEFAESQYEGAKAQYTAAKENLRMAETGARPEDKKSLEMALKLAQDQLALAQTNLSYTRIRAPFAGTVTAKRTEVGEFAAPGAPLFELADMDNLELQIFLPSQSVQQLALGDTASFIPEVDHAVRSATVARIFPASSEKSKQVEVRLQVLPEATQGLRPGGFADVVILREEGRGNVVLPLKAILDLATEQPRIFVVEDGNARQVMVELGATTGREAEIISPLNGGEQVVVVGQNYLSDGATVRLVKPDNAGGSQ